jgi:hypothetical protein
MTVPSSARNRLGRVLNDARRRRDQRLESERLRSELVTFSTTSELSELSAIAARSGDADTVEVRTQLVRALSR